jgi:hypothetical protein
VLYQKHAGPKQIDIALCAAELFNVQLKGGHPFVGDAEYCKEGNPKGLGFAVFVAGISPGFAEKQCPRFNFVPIKTHLVLKKMSLNVNGKYSLFWLR